MQRFKLIALMTITGLLLFLSGCQKDILMDEASMKNIQNVDQKNFIKVSQVRPIERYLKRMATDNGGRQKGFTIENLDTTRLLQAEFSPTYKTYTLNIHHNEPGKIYNLVFKEENGIMYKPSVMEYHMTPQFVKKYNAGEVNFSQFQGTIAQYRVDTKFSTGNRNGDIDCDCFKVWINLNGPNGGNGGGGLDPGLIIGGLNFGGFNTNFPDNNSGTTTTGSTGLNGGTGSSGTTGTTSGPANNGSHNPWLIPQCPPYWVPVFIPYYGFICIHMRVGFAGGPSIGPLEPDGKMESLINDMDGTREDEKCNNLIQGIGILGNSDNKINDYAESANPFVTQLNNCINNNAIEAKIKELKNLKIIEPCSGDIINTNLEYLAMSLCFGCGEDGVGLTPQSLEDAFYEELEGVDYITWSELEKYTEIFEIFGITSDSEKSQFVSGKDCSQDPDPDCSNCTPFQKLVVGADNLRSQQMLRCAIKKLKEATGNPDHSVWQNLMDYFKNDTPKMSEYLISVFNWINLQSYNNSFEIGGAWCSEITIAYTYPLLFADIHLCSDNYFTRDPYDRSETIIHEMMHLYFFRADLGYKHETEKFYGLSPTSAKWNADTYSEFVKSICL